ncbi:Xylosidase/arabinosidase [Lachnellula subtilissima]|uniref:Xylosidase/arabinosidase n=1 Tax=Lachnellula subtilissima TaxID=602034 RepID=A0A8H8RZG8_9HELO|nr:Xylosidase/arabinosidase [Lachnellula subtilissima]
MALEPLVKHLFTADPSAHVFEGKLFVYPSHDRKTDIKDNDNGDQYDMNDYHVFSMESVGGPVTDHGLALKAETIPWVSKQLWAPDAAFKKGKYYLYFPARDKDGVFRIGVAESDVPQGPFKPEPEAIAGSYSIDPASFVDDDGQAYLYFGGIWGGQLQCWTTGKFDGSAYANMEASGNVPALLPRAAKLSEDMRSFTSNIKELAINGADGQLLQAEDHDRRFFEAAWMHKYNGKYYFSYSTGDTHFLVYATGDSPLGPFTYRGKILNPVEGWTTHHSIVEFKGKWYLFYHDTSLSGENHLRCVKVREILLIPKADRKKIHEYLFREGVLVAKKDYNLPKHNDIDTKNLFVVKACQSLTSRGYVKTQFSWQYYYYTLTPEGLDYLREWLHLPAEIVPATHIKQQRSHAPPRGMMGGEGERERKPFGGRGGRGGGERGDREGGYRRREPGAEGKEGAPSGEFAPQFRGGFGRGRGAAPPS